VQSQGLLARPSKIVLKAIELSLIYFHHHSCHLGDIGRQCDFDGKVSCTRPGVGSQTFSSGLTSASYTNSFVYTHLGQLWQGPLNGSSTSYRYFYCGSAPHQLSGLYSTGTTCANKASAVYQSSYNA
jgi:hypothetical protein